eukprot:SAG22_NODE_8524_length_648_cov_1.209472_1_plen_77_part_10
MPDHTLATQTGVGINFPAICTVDRVYRRAEDQCERNFERDFPHRYDELGKNGDYKTGRRRLSRRQLLAEQLPTAAAG